MSRARSARGSMPSDLNKPNGQALIPPARGADFVATLPVARFHGIGPATAARMERLGLHTGADLRACELAFLQAHFGKSGRWYFNIARGIDNRPVQPHRPRKSIGSEDTFSADLFALAAAQSEVAGLAARVWRQAAARQITGRCVTVKVKYADFQQITRSRTHPRPFDGAGEFTAAALQLLDPLFPTQKGIRLLGVTLSALEPPPPPEAQLSLW